MDRWTHFKAGRILKRCTGSCGRSPWFLKNGTPKNRTRFVLKLVAVFAASATFTHTLGESPPEQGYLSHTVPARIYPHSYSLCGPACLVLAARWCDVIIPMEYAIEETHWVPKGTSLLNIKNAAERLGLRCDVVRCESHATLQRLATDASCVCIGPFDKDHFAVLVGRDADSAQLLDPIRRQPPKVVTRDSAELQFAQGRPLLIIGPGHPPSHTEFALWKLIGLVGLLLFSLGSVQIFLAYRKGRCRRTVNT